MADEKPPTNQIFAIITPVIALLGLGVSLLGNVVQYQTLKAKQQELRQAQTTLDATQQDSRRKQDAFDTYLHNLEQRLATIDTQIEQAKMEQRRGAAGVAFAPLEQKQIALDIIATGAQTEKDLLLERAKVQDKLDAARAMTGAR